MNKFMKSIWQLIIGTPNATLEVPSLRPCWQLQHFTLLTYSEVFHQVLFISFKMHTQKISTNSYFLISCFGNYKNNVFFFTMTTVTQVENPYSSTQNIKLINTASFKSNQSLFLKIKCHKRSFPHWLLRSLGIKIGTKAFESDQNFRFLLYPIILHKDLFHYFLIVEY